MTTSTHCFSVPFRKWFEESTLVLDFPDEWEIVPCPMNGHSKPRITREAIANGFAHPIGTRPLAELAKGKKQVAIVFDDLSRPTPVAHLMPFILAELSAAGIRDESMRLICATACHGAHTYMDFEKKLGKDVMERFAVYNHNVYENCTYVGTTSQGTPLSINSEVAACDLKVGIGAVIPHMMTGFGGGGKIILPGVASIESITANHDLANQAKVEGKGDKLGMGNYVGNPVLKDIVEAAQLGGLDFKIDVLVNGSGEACDIFCGDVAAEFAAAVECAVDHYATKPIRGADIAVVNSYSKGNEAAVGMFMGIAMLAEKGGDLVLIMDCPSGQVVHYLVGSFGKYIRGRQFQSINAAVPWVRRTIVVCPQVEHATRDWLAMPDTVWVKSWRDAVGLLRRDYPGSARVGVVPDGTVQYFR